MRPYIDEDVVEPAEKDYIGAPACHAVDFGVTSSGETPLVEADDGYALGYYWLQHVPCAKPFPARWAELTGAPDECAA